MKLTKQGVRDLNHIKGPSKGLRLPEPPVPVSCKHKDCREVNCYMVRYLICNTCSKVISEW